MKSSGIASVIMTAIFLAIPAAAALARDAEQEIFSPTEELQEQARQAEAALL